MALAPAHLAPWAPWSNLVMHVNRAIDDRPGIQQIRRPSDISGLSSD